MHSPMDTSKFPDSPILMERRKTATTDAAVATDSVTCQAKRMDRKPWTALSERVESIAGMICSTQCRQIEEFASLRSLIHVLEIREDRIQERMKQLEEQCEVLERICNELARKTSLFFVENTERIEVVEDAIGLPVLGRKVPSINLP
ncbi:uncharacterized protein PV09_07581 [Verruconis gallopava]|uniref:Uncharacterized protein n=1 Tax=Verruconis gallopava TaxID=253628 RepID=A0A0D2A229_9PEZI|nr:uncharacterized protein PV09_07581 [Verruconis gallopava]KIW00818.1 hypothetical protein PV09_07581 [Verruconis gallopava]